MAITFLVKHTLDKCTLFPGQQLNSCMAVCTAWHRQHGLYSRLKTLIQLWLKIQEKIARILRRRAELDGPGLVSILADEVEG